MNITCIAYIILINRSEQVIKTLVTNNNTKSLQNTFVPLMMSSTIQKQSNDPIKNSITTYINHHSQKH